MVRRCITVDKRVYPSALAITTGVNFFLLSNFLFTTLVHGLKYRLSELCLYFDNSCKYCTAFMPHLSH